MSLAPNLPLVRYFRYAATTLGVVGAIVWVLLLFSAAYGILLVLWVVGLRGPFLFHRLVVLRLAELVPRKSVPHNLAHWRFCGS